MELSDYLESQAFFLFMDEDLRREASKAVEQFFRRTLKPADKAQLYSIPSIIQAGGRSALERLARKQMEKNTKPENKAFWQFIFDLLFNADPPDFALRYYLQQHLAALGFLQEDTAGSTKPEQRQIRKANRAKIESVIDTLLPVYFEHFNCHYFFRLQQGGLHEST